jgi:TonB family protein
LAELLPSAAALAQRGAGAPVADVSPSDAEEGEATALNARAFRYASFFERVSQRLRSHWHVREAVERMRRRGQPLVEHEVHKTRVHVVLGADGALRSASVVGPSGFDELDQAGRQAFVSAAPFLHPPRGLLAGRAEVAFDFEFALSVEASSVFGGLDWQGVPP